MTKEQAQKIGITISDFEKLESNVDDAFKTVCNSMLNKKVGDFTKDEIVIYMLGKRDMKHREHHIFDKTMEDKKLMSELELSLYENYQEYKKCKVKYHNFRQLGEEKAIAEAHKEMTTALYNMLDTVSKLFSDVWSCSECEAERIALTKFAKNIYQQYC